MRQLLGDEAEELFAALAGPPDVGLRVNPLRGDAQLLRERLPWPLREVPWCPTCYVVDEEDGAEGVPPGRHPYQAAGAYYLQDPAATAVAEALAPEPGDLVLDLAAAPGGKSTHLAALMGAQGWLVANDVHGQRAQALVGNLERCGVGNATVTSETPARLAQAWPGRFDRVLLDAPCSGEGMFRKSEDAVAMWSEENVARSAIRQGELLLEAARLVRPGGYLAYSTCTFAPEENEGSVARFVAATGFEVVPLDLPGTAPGRPEWAGAGDGAPYLPELAGAARIWPHRAPGEGHFVALLRRPDEGGAVAARQGRRRSAGSERAVDARARAAWRDFAGGALADGWAERLEPTYASGEWLGRLPEPRLVEERLPLNGLRWLRHGLQLGRVRVGARAARLEPAHALAMWLPAGAAERLDLAPGDERVARFLQGADLEAPGGAGYLRVEVDGLPLGWGKRSGGVVRSLLPKGLRQPA